MHSLEGNNTYKLRDKLKRKSGHFKKDRLCQQPLKDKNTKLAICIHSNYPIPFSVCQMGCASWWVDSYYKID